ncbi:prephenate dehydratase [Alterisphingorhabdus coralli]|uniref:prephenate dehydratase n=1 Tax=Alterisphingorhabdus coralli TaxID=3071408 RepID=A0AA97F8R3_9SPHN|nr:prephenate dehydratase [Parasphingorhabdus sp. SCSIO 66989]WOE76226.1 prephenate dehydratase [Parasphingorhabdus sp. SCSIO 66989]
MQSYPTIALEKVHEMAAKAKAEPSLAVAFQGAPGANSHIACSRYDTAALPMPCFSFADAIDAVRHGSADRAIIPIENSQHGRVADIHFLLPESGLSIIAETFLPIHHCLMARGEGPHKEVLSHPQALGQCRHYLKQHGMTPIAYADTAGAAARVAESDELSLAAIAPEMAAELYGLQIIAKNIEDADHNMTRFVVLSRIGAAPDEDQPVMTTLTFEVKSIPAALYKALGGFATNNVNITKLESYQRGGSFSAAEFYADIEGMPGDPSVDRALEELAFHSKWVRLLGSYPRARERGR